MDVGGEARFVCQYEPKELSSKWYKGTDLVRYAVEQERVKIDNVSLVILKVEERDEGKYTCKVGEDEESAFLKVSTSMYMKEMWFCLLDRCFLFLIRQWERIDFC